KWSFGFNAYVTQRFYRDFQRNASGFSPSFGYPITPDLRINMGYTLEWIDISADFGGTTTGTALADLDRDGRNSAVNASIAYDTRDNRLFPTEGQYHLASFELSHPWIGSDDALQYNRAQVFFRYYHPLPLGLVFRANLQIGYVFSFGDQGVPISERFFRGGIFSVRGSEPRGLRPTIRTLQEGDPSSDCVDFIKGGNKELVLNLEIEFPIIEAAGIRGVIFADAGNAYDDDQNFFYAGTPEDLVPDAYVIRSNDRIKSSAVGGLY